MPEAWSAASETLQVEFVRTCAGITFLQRNYEEMRKGRRNGFQIDITYAFDMLLNFG